MLRFVLLFIIKFILGAEAGASFSWSAKWQEKTFFGHKLQKLPELLDALILAVIAIQGYSALGFDMTSILTVGYGDYLLGVSAGIVAFIISFMICLGGIESATWMFLRWESHDDPNTARTSTIKPLVDRIANKLGFKLGSEGYAWIASAVKGTIITLPLGGLGGIFFALGYEVGSHAEGRVNKWFNPFIIKEGLSFAFVGIYAVIYLEVCKLLG